MVRRPGGEIQVGIVVVSVYMLGEEEIIRLFCWEDSIEGDADGERSREDGISWREVVFGIGPPLTVLLVGIDDEIDISAAVFKPLYQGYVVVGWGVGGAA